MDTSVPFSMYDDLQKHGILPDLYFQDNAEPALALSGEDFTYQTLFDLSPDLAECDSILLHFAGVDTLSDIYLNGEWLGEPYNMHRDRAFPVKHLLPATGNLLDIHFHSPTRFMKEALEKHGSIPSNTDTLDGFAYLRKSACMSGWDWGPKLPDMGLFREVTLMGIDQDRIYSVLVRQKHQDGKVSLSFDVDSLRTQNKEPAQYAVTVTAPDGTSLFAADANDGIVIENPQLWWPNGYGEQPLYTVRVES
ncbi:MAG: glycoside hydrolase family 2 protein, partial [Lachnospiraceae bacterium]|nr:glycoside hydrolase family 2 protein [Lachnospiraceae bacterium]